MPLDRTPNFSQLVCSPLPVQQAFALHRPTGVWWRIVLGLHGKPAAATVAPDVRTARIADGFRFYAHLYRALSVVFFLLALALLVLGSKGDVVLAPFGSAATLLAALYLWCVSGLGYAGARAYANKDKQARGVLIAFLVMIVAFLSVFVAAVSVLALYNAWLPPFANIAGNTVLLVFGVGSYFIEIVYLATA